MAVLGNILKGNIFTGIALGVGAAILGPVIIPRLARVAKPLAKAAIKGGFTLLDKGKELAVEVGETVENIVTELKVVMSEAQKEAATTTDAPKGRRRVANPRGSRQKKAKTTPVSTVAG